MDRPGFTARLATVLSREGGDDPFATHQEGHLKVILMRALLRMGHTVHEGSNLPNIGFSLSADPEDSMHPVWTRGPRIHRRIDGGSADLASTSPTDGGGGPILYEIKSHPDHGSKCGLRAGLAEDLVRAAENPDLLSVSAFDPKALLAFSGRKSERRGRKGNHPWLEGFMPPSEELPPGTVVTVARTVAGVGMVLSAVRSPSTGITFAAAARKGGRG